jgi:type VI secretion system protein ImpL
MINWLKQVASEFFGLAEIYPAIILFAIVVLILIALLWIWLEVPASSVSSDGSKWWIRLLVFIKHGLVLCKDWLLHLIQHLFVSSSDIYQTPLYLEFKPTDNKSLLADIPASQIRRNIPKYMRRFHRWSADDHWYLLRDMVLVELSVDVVDDDSPALATGIEESKRAPRSLRRVIDKISRTRPQRPLDGIVVTIPAALLADASSDALSNMIDRTVLGLDFIDSEVPFALPVYLIVSHCESMTGFNAFVHQNWEHHDQIFGWSSDIEFGEKYRRSSIRRAFKFIHDEITRNQVEISARKAALIQGDQFMLLDRQINGLADGAELVCEKLFDDSSYKNGFYFRGIYFVGQNLEDEKLERSSGSAFLSELLESKISAEANLAVPTGHGMRRHKNLLDRYKQISLLLVMLLFGFGGYNLWSLKVQIDKVKGVLVDDQSSHRASGNSYAQVHNVLDQLSKIDARKFNRIGLPVSWFANVNDDLAQAVSHNQLEGIVFPAMECNLGMQFRTLLRYKPQFSDIDVNQGFQWVFAEAWLNELEVFHTTRQNFINLSEPSNGNDQLILEKFSDLIYSVYGIKPSAGFFQRSDLYELAMDRLDYRYQSGNDECPGSTGVDQASSRLFWDAIGANSAQFYRKIQESSLSPSRLISNNDFSNSDGGLGVKIKALDSTQNNGMEFVELERWLEYLEAKWLGDASGANPCGDMRRRLSEIHRMWDNHTKASSDVAERAIALFSPSYCEDVFYKQLFKNSYKLVSKPFIRDKNKRVQLSPGMSTFRGNYGSVQNLTFMSLDTSDLPTKMPDTIEWDATRLINALSYYREYERYAITNFNSVKLMSEEHAVGDAYQLQKAMLKQLRNAIIYEIEWAKEGANKRLSQSSNVIVSAEQQVLQRVRNFDTVVEAFYQLRDVLAQLGFIADSQAWVESTRAATLSVLHATDRLAINSRLYLPQARVDRRNTDILPALYGIDNAADLKTYLASQNERASYIAYNYVESLVTYLLNSHSGLTASQTALERRWQDTLMELDKYARKDPSNALTALEGQFSDSLTIKLADCPSQFIVGPGDDIFTHAEVNLTLSIKIFCDRIKSTDASKQYDELVKKFKENLQGRYPFTDKKQANVLELDDASLVAVRHFFNKFDDVSEGLIREFNDENEEAKANNQTSDYQAPLDFLNRLKSVSDFLKWTFNQSSGSSNGGITAQIVFRAYTTPSVGLDQIISQSFNSSGESASQPGSNSKIKWDYGSTVNFSARLANTSSYLLTGSSNATVKVSQPDITFHESGAWALLKLLQRYQVSPGLQPTVANPGSVILEFPIRVKRAQRRVAVADITAPPLVARVFKIPVGLDLYGLNPETKQIELLKLPDSFPFSAPTL